MELVFLTRHPRPLNESKSSRPRVSLVALFGFVFSVYLTSTLLWGDNPNVSLDGPILLMSGLVALCASLLAARRVGERPAMTDWVVSGLVVASTSLVFRLAGSPTDWNLHAPNSVAAQASLDQRLAGPFHGPSSYFASFLVIYLIVAAFAPVNKGLRVAGSLSAGCALLLTLSRGGLIAAAVGCAVAGVVLAKRPRWVIVTLAAVLAGLSIASQVVVDTRGFGRGSAFLEDAARTELRAKSLELITERPFAGWGWRAWESIPGLEDGTHNYLLTIALEAGVIGLLLFTLLVGTAFVRLTRISEANCRAAAIGAMAGLLTNSLVEASLEGVFFQLFCLSLVGTFLGLPTQQRRAGFGVALGEARGHGNLIAPFPR
jgi:O-antigen ligase